MFGMLGLDYGFGFDYLDPHADGYRGESDISIKNKGYFGKLNFTHWNEFRGIVNLIAK
jgi:outer membrane protein insertion porin family